MDVTGDGETGAERPDQQTHLANALETLVEQDDRWRVTPSPGCVTVTRGWPDGSVDTLIIVSPETAYARREDARERQVWAIKGTVDEIVAAARDVPAPFAPGAPDDPGAAGPSGYWT